MTRLTFVGDIALDKPLLKAAKERGNGQFDFRDVFQTKSVFSNSDLVIGNLETCFGGGKRFNKKPYHYNSPDSFCKAIKDAGIDLVSTANNHCMDEGVWAYGEHYSSLMLVELNTRGHLRMIRENGTL